MKLKRKKITEVKKRKKENEKYSGNWEGTMICLTRQGNLFNL